MEPSPTLRARGRTGADPGLADLPASRRRPLGRRAGGRHDPRIGIHPAAGLPRPRGRPDLRASCAAYILDQQLPDGGWAIYPGGPAEVSASVKAYFALKLVGLLGRRPRAWSGRARRSSTAGGAQACNSFTRFYLALLGQIGYDECPSVPPELVLLPSRLDFSLERDVGLDADDRRAALDHVGVQAGAAARARARDRASCSVDDLHAAGPRRRRPRLLDELLPRRRPGPEVGRPLAARRPGGSGASRRPIAGCSSTSRTPTAWGRSSRR